MRLKVFIILTITSCVTANLNCNNESVIIAFKRPTFEFSMRILERVALEKRGHFVFSPISAWTQLVSLAEGAKGNTFREIWRTTQYHRHPCFRRKWRQLYNVLMKELSNWKTSSVFIIDKLLDVKKQFRREIERSDEVRVLSLDFDHPESSATKANHLIAHQTNGVIGDIIFPTDFADAALLLADASYFKILWSTPFNPSYTKVSPFYAGDRTVIGKVNLMYQTGYFNITYHPLLSCQVLEIPSTGRITMLVFLPSNSSAEDIFHKLKRTRLASIFNNYAATKVKLVNIGLPRFNITSEVDNLPELLYDMGLKTIFRPDRANFKGISEFPIYVSLMTYVSYVDVTEVGVKAASIAEPLMNGAAKANFLANRPFAYMLVDRITEAILFAGVYSNPSVY